ncbi:late competence development ComFB family protein [Deltaproteobacteria bacterium TL4]
MDSEILVRDVSLKHIINRNEERVGRLMPRVLDEFPGRNFSDIDIEDIYALTLNRLTPRYVQFGSLIEHEDLTDERIQDQIRNAIRIVTTHPR